MTRRPLDFYETAGELVDTLLGIHIALTPSWYGKLERETARQVKRNLRST